MKSTTFASSLALVLTPVTFGHTILSRFYINGQSQGDSTCIRVPLDSRPSTDPITDVTSDDMACGFDGTSGANFTCPSSAGATLTFEFRIWPDAREPGSIDPSHRGPCSVYVKPVSDILADRAAGPGWFKIWHEGYDEDEGLWCTEKLINNRGLLSVELPSGLPAGYYLVRPELVALHQAYNQGIPEYYLGCAQIYIENGPRGSLDIPSQYQVSIPGYLDGSEPGNNFNIYSPEFPYVIPGPEPYSPSASSNAAASEMSRSSSSLSAIDGAIPSDCLLKNGNWCGRPIEPYSDSSGCWAAVEECFAQGNACYNPAPATGVKNCDQWNRLLCHAIQDRCDAGNFEGPPEVYFNEIGPDPPGRIPAAVNKGAGAFDSHWGSAPGFGAGEGSHNEEAEGGETPVDSPRSASTSRSSASSPRASATPRPGEYEDGKDVGDDGPRLVVSPDGTCGGTTGYTCIGSSFGDCCSSRGRCGLRTRHCGCGCQSGFGLCRRNSGRVKH
ncbi:carbohydrate-binding module family 18 protein [Sodiomyces alcalophilus JCM 7366]|uniref:carbohydrate-binding module family 18 protein n=1 Tax=Sodiomyces alcalophilus JCM 7366 TaxID=591952 RepID=UPI0039B65601